MPLTPHRPFVPYRTPSTQAPSIRGEEFRLSRPFVHGVQSERAGAELIPPIEHFLDAGPDKADDSLPEFNYGGDELPPVEHFVDPLPGVGAFSPDEHGSLTGDSTGMAGVYASSDSPVAATEEQEWVLTDWQEYDWRGAAALGEGADPQATDAWAATDWERRATPPIRDLRETAAQAIATALDRIAQRIRSGELAVVPGGGVPDQATIAAALAALLGVRG